MRGRSNTLLIELILVLLFFALSAGVVLQVFAKAHQFGKDSEDLTDALLIVQNWAELLSASENPEETLLSSGWVLEDQSYTLEEAHDLMARASITQQKTDSGLLSEITLSVEAKSPEETVVLVEVPVVRYVPEAGG